MNNTAYRLNDLINPSDGHSLVVDTSGGLTLGVLPGLENFSEATKPLLHLVDGIVTSPGQSRNLVTRTHQDAALIVRADWTNALRGDDFVLPPEQVSYLPLLEPSDALDLGANALVMHFILGHTEEIEAQCLKRVVHLALEGQGLGMPLIVDVQPIGSRVVLQNKAIELGVSYALEGGADGIAIPWPGVESFKIIQTMCSGVPVWVKPGNPASDGLELEEVMEGGSVGFWLDEQIFADADPVNTLRNYHSLVHIPMESSIGGEV